MKFALTLQCAILTSLLSFSAMAASCPPQGRGGDPIANRLQNRREIPATYQELDVPTLESTFTPDLHTPAMRDQFTPAQINYIAPRERRAIALTGYLLMAEHAAHSPANCGSYLHRDILMWVSTVPEIHPREAKLLRAKSVLVQLTPASQAAHPEWSLNRLEHLARRGAQVRISGWLYYDASARAALGKTRATLWAISPVTRIEIWKNGGWKADLR